VSASELVHVAKSLFRSRLDEVLSSHSSISQKKLIP
jgi:hypothetical protein